MAYGAELCCSQPLPHCDWALLRYVKTVLSIRATTSSSVALYEAGLLPFDAYAQEYTLRFFFKLNNLSLSEGAIYRETFITQ